MLLCIALAYCSDSRAIVATPSYKESSVNIFVGNLAFSATDRDLRQLFEQYGEVEKINLITDRETGRPRGFGFVEMPDAQAAQAAIAGLHGKQFGDRALTVNEARPREQRRAPRQPRW
jgi:cold-inducible RNA-binding protein